MDIRKNFRLARTNPLAASVLQSSCAAFFAFS
jgi:hypothetical protein